MNDRRRLGEGSPTGRESSRKGADIVRRHVMAEQGRTTIALEADFWRAADMQAAAQGMDWQNWAAAQLEARPGGYGRASWLRVAILRGAIDG